MTISPSSGVTDVIVSVGFVLALAAAALFLLYARRGKAIRAMLDQAQADQDQKFHKTKGKVRPPPIGPLP